MALFAQVIVDIANCGGEGRGLFCFFIYLFFSPPSTSFNKSSCVASCDVTFFLLVVFLIVFWLCASPNSFFICFIKFCAVYIL